MDADEGRLIADLMAELDRFRSRAEAHARDLEAGHLPLDDPGLVQPEEPGTDPADLLCREAEAAIDREEAQLQHLGQLLQRSPLVRTARPGS